MSFDKGGAHNLIFYDKRADPELIALQFPIPKFNPCNNEVLQGKNQVVLCISCLVIGDQELDISKQQIFGGGVGYCYKNKSISSSVLRCNLVPLLFTASLHEAVRST